MSTFAQMQKQPQKSVSSRLARSHTPPKIDHRADLFLHAQRTIENQVAQRIVSPPAEELEAGSIGMAAPRSGHDFSQLSVFPLLSDDEVYTPEAEDDLIVLGQGYPGSAQPAAPVWGPGAPNGPPAPVPAPAPTPTPIPACAITSHATAPAPDGTPNTRTTIGVCETIEFDAGGQVVDWSATMGWPRVEAGKATLRWAAPEVGGTATISATRPGSGETCTLDMKVEPPKTIQYTKKSEDTLPSGTIGAGMRLEGTILPLYVTFGWIAVKEDPGLPTGVTGYFARLRRRQGVSLAHNPNPNFRRVTWDNHFTDHAALSGPWPHPSGAGNFQWVIPNRYRCLWSTGTGQWYDDTTQTFSIDASGTFTITKEGESVNRTP